MDYKKYSLENLENWLYDAMSCGEATSQEIYDVIIKVVKDEYYTYKKKASESYELLALLNDNGQSYEDVLKEREYYEGWDPQEKILSCDKNDPSPECKGAWSNFWEQVDNDVKENIEKMGYDWTPNQKEKDKVTKWILPTQIDGLTGDVIVNLPDDLLERAGLKEGDVVEWIDRGDGSFEIRKANGSK